MRDERLRRLFTFQAMYAGLAPQQALAIYSVITYMDCVAGVYYPMGGMHAVPGRWPTPPRSTASRFRYGARASSIEVSDGRARAVITEGGERIPGRRRRGQRRLTGGVSRICCPRSLPRDARAARAIRRRASWCMRDLTVAVARRRPPHDLLRERLAQRLSTRSSRDGRLMSDPSFLLCTPSLTDPSLAPPGRHAYYALFPAPNLDHRAPIDWALEGPRYRDRMLDTLERRGFPALAGADVLHMTTPADWQARGITAGAPFAAAHTFGADRTVPSADPGSADREPRRLRLAQPAGRGRADGDPVRPTRGRARHR